MCADVRMTPWWTTRPTPPPQQRPRPPRPRRRSQGTRRAATVLYCTVLSCTVLCCTVLQVRGALLLPRRPAVRRAGRAVRAPRQAEARRGLRDRHRRGRDDRGGEAQHVQRASQQVRLVSILNPCRT